MSHDSPLHDWFDQLAIELFQTERSAMSHPLKEAQRLVDTPLAELMHHVSAHAESSLRTLATLLPDYVAGEALGSAFSLIRDHVADHALTLEMSYRGTLLGMTHGVDMVRILRPVAARCGRAELVDFLDTWLPEREAMLETCRQGTLWFVDHVEVARTPVSKAKVKELARKASS